MTQKMENERVSNPRNSWRNWNSWFGLISYSFLLSQLNTITLNRHTNKLQMASKRKYNNYLLRAGQLVNPNGYIFRLRFDTHSRIYLKEISIYFFSLLMNFKQIRAVNGFADLPNLSGKSVFCFEKMVFSDFFYFHLSMQIFIQASSWCHFVTIMATDMPISFLLLSHSRIYLFNFQTKIELFN